MKDPDDVKRAFAHLCGWRVPVMTGEERDAWKPVIESLTVAQFQAAMRGARQRPADRIHLRPGVEEFRSFATSGYRPPTPHPDGPAPAPNPNLNLSRLAELRAVLGPTRKARR